VTSGLKEKILQRREDLLEIQKRDEGLYQLVYWDYTPEWYEAVDEHDHHGLFTEFAMDNIIASHPDKWLDGAMALRMDLSWMVVTKDGVHWKGYIKHTDVEIHTATIRWTDLDGEGSSYEDWKSEQQGSDTSVAD
jgi:hypothetical protein